MIYKCSVKNFHLYNYEIFAIIKIVAFTLHVQLYHDIGDIWEHPDVYKDKPFFELINFSDCEGFIGHTVCEKLAKDFRDNEHLIPAEEKNCAFPYFYEKYKEWKKALELASDSGAVQFC